MGATRRIRLSVRTIDFHSMKGVSTTPCAAKRLTKTLIINFMDVKRNTVNVIHCGSVVKLDVDRIIALDSGNRRAYFEFAVWDFNEEDFNKVCGKWNGYDACD